MTKVLIVEDEMPSARKLQTFISQIRPDYEVVNILESVKETVDFLTETEVDLIFLDIHLADGNSFSIFDQLEVHCPIIFTTAFDEYALQAFTQYAVDYLLKPLSRGKLLEAIEKYEKMFGGRTAQEGSSNLNYHQLSELIQSGKPIEYKQRFMVYYRETIRTVSVEEIAYFFAESKSVFLMTREGQYYDINYTLDQLEQELDPKNFFRANRKFLIMIDAVKEASAYSKGKLKLFMAPEAPSEVFISAEKATRFKQWLNI
ncbi:LytTR family DNA-binding domain-containing protein [Persicobacter sp. CCB-QB2]|uniref:LytR/AlgR family response regulator transcription factor n=1 Tax=Persicobacter sp. CCB-QB2 TaxID=1561025 RepID=UPI0006A9AA2A|nr:LytTR family DNA-binding domain-containing protein [Persicobacter sp. CCB-QB2]